MTKRDDHACLDPDCEEPAPWGFRATREKPWKWACGKHRHLLQQPAAAPAPAPIGPAQKGVPIGDLFGGR